MVRNDRFDSCFGRSSIPQKKGDVEGFDMIWRLEISGSEIGGNKGLQQAKVEI